MSSSGGDSSGPPTAADDVIFDMLSGNCTIDSAAACRSLDCQGGMGNYPNTLTHNASITLSIGDGTAGTGNRALRFSSTMTYTKGSTSSSAISFVSTSATQQTITTAGKVLGNTTFNATSNGSWILSDAFSANGGATTVASLTKGSLDTNGQTCTFSIFDSSNGNVRSLTLGTSSITLTGSWSMSNTANLTFSGASSTITMTGADRTFDGGGKTYGTLIYTGSGFPQINGANTFATYTRTGTAAKTDGIILGANQVVSGTCTLTPNSIVNALLITSNTLGTAYSITAATLVCTNRVDFRDITGAGAATWTTGASGATYFGDCGGNSGITFTTPATQTWSGTSGGNWSANAWTSRVPLPQDDVVINAAFSASQTVTLDMPRAGKSINWTGATGNPAWAKTTATTIYGSVTMIAGMTNSGTATVTMEGRGAFTFTSATQVFTNTLVVSMFGGSLTLQDAYSSNRVATGAITLTDGTLDFSNFSVTLSSGGLNLNGSATTLRTITLGSGTTILGGAGTILNGGTSSNLTVTATTGTISLTDTGASSKTFASGGKTFGVLNVTTGGAGAVIITGAVSLTRITATGGGTKTFTLPGSTTTTLTGTTPFPSGAAGNLLTFAPSSGSATVSFSNQASCDYVSLTNIVASGTTPAYAGTHSTNGGGNTNWLFSAPGTGQVTIRSGFIRPQFMRPRLVRI